MERDVLHAAISTARPLTPYYRKSYMPSLTDASITIVSVAAFLFAANYFSRIMASKGIPSGFGRGFFAFFLALAATICVGELVAWIFSL